MYKKICKLYFDYFSRKDLTSLAEIFAENITLRDWEISAKGKTEVISANMKIFEAVETIKVVPINLYEEKNTVIAELEIKINNKENLFVVDVISFEESGKIESIRAYKGN